MSTYTGKTKKKRRLDPGERGETFYSPDSPSVLHVTSAGGYQVCFEIDENPDDTAAHDGFVQFPVEQIATIMSAMVDYTGYSPKGLIEAATGRHNQPTTTRQQARASARTKTRTSDYHKPGLDTIKKVDPAGVNFTDSYGDTLHIGADRDSSRIVLTITNTGRESAKISFHYFDVIPLFIISGEATGHSPEALLQANLASGHGYKNLPANRNQRRNKRQKHSQTQTPAIPPNQRGNTLPAGVPSLTALMNQ